MQRTNIEWTDYSWNPIKGICPVGCFYCYARRMYQRFKWNPEIRITEKYPEIIPMPMYDNKGKQISRKVFVCSTFELFHPLVKKEWRDWIFDNIKYNYHLTFQILTKFPQNIDRPMPNNVWLGCTITGDDNQRTKGFDLFLSRARVKFISFEPLFKPIEIMDELSNFDWIIIGRLTQCGHIHDPKLGWIKKIVRHCADYGIKVFLKDNLKEIFGEPLIQEFPNV